MQEFWITYDTIATRPGDDCGWMQADSYVPHSEREAVNAIRENIDHKYIVDIRVRRICQETGLRDVTEDLCIKVADELAAEGINSLPDCIAKHAGDGPASTAAAELAHERQEAAAWRFV